MTEMKAVSVSKAEQTFSIRGKNYHYFYHDYNKAWANERTVEVPIINDVLLHTQAKKILELGNVMSHYFSVDHTIVDKYETGPAVLNEDILEYKNNSFFDLIISISTLEHIGWDESPRDPDKAPKALEKLKSLLTPNGNAYITVPVGYNPYLDRALEENRLGFRTSFLKRTTFDNQWEECSIQEAFEMPYNRRIIKNKNSPFNGANGLAFVTFGRETS